MKKGLSFLLMLTMVVSSLLSVTVNAAVGDIAGKAVHTDIVAYINHYAIPSYAANGQSCIVAEDLRNFGFDVIWDGDARTLSIYRNTNLWVSEMQVKKTEPTGSFFSNLFETDIKVYANGIPLTSYTLNGYTMVPVEELTMFGEVYWVPEERAIKLWVDGLSMRETKQQPIILPSEGETKTETSTNYQVGDCITFGRYEQDNNIFNGDEEIEWLVLDMQGEKALIVSKKILFYSSFRYYSDYEITRWDNSLLRKRLNTTFYETAFTDAERELITITNVTANKNKYYNTDPGISTEDNVFVLSLDEIEKYMSSKDKRVCNSTEFAKTDVGNGHFTSMYWTRTCGNFTTVFSAVNLDGSIFYEGISGFNYLGVRPAMWIEINSLKEISKQSQNSRADDTEPYESEPPRMENLKVGDHILFGKYELDTDDNGNEYIKWLVLDIQGKNVLLISEYGVEYLPYNMVREEVTWDDCTLRKWLNDDFLNGAFNEAEKATIKTTTINSVKDKVFLLSENEVQKYFSQVNHRDYDASPYVLDKIIESKNEPITDTGKYPYWTRSSDGEQASAVESTFTDFFIVNYDVNDNKVVRPAIWVEVSI